MVKDLVFDDLRTRMGCEYAFLKIGNKEGIINRNLEWVIKPKYDFIKPCFKDCFIIKKDDKYGVVDKFDNIIIPIMYDYIISNPDINSDCVIVSQNGKFGIFYIDVNTEMPIAYDFLYSLDFKHFVYILNNKYGLTNGSNSILIPCEYDDMDCFKDFVIATNRYKAVKCEDRAINVDDEISVGVLDFNNNVLIPFEYKDIVCLNNSDKTIPFKECLFAVKKDNTYKLINSKSEIINETDFKTFKPWGDLVYKASIDEDISLFFNTNGKQIFELNYLENNICKFVSVNNAESIACYTKGFDSKDCDTDIVNNEGEILFSDKIEKLKTNGNNAIILKKQGKYGVVDKSNNIIIPFKEGELYGWNDFYIRRTDCKWLFETIVKEEFV